MIAIHRIHILYIKTVIYYTCHVQNSKNIINYNKKLILLQYSKNENQKIKIKIKKKCRKKKEIKYELKKMDIKEESKIR